MSRPFIQTMDPSTGETNRAFHGHSTDEALGHAASAARAQRDWRRTALTTRADLLNATAAVLRERQDALARLMATEMGKPVTDGRAEVEKCAWVCEHYATHGASYLSDSPIDTDASASWVSIQPLGVVLAVMPWNYPLWQVFRFVAPALMAGNGFLLKHASNVPGCAEQILDMLREAGMPDPLGHALFIGHDSIPPLLQSPDVVAATLTGSTRAGQSLAETAGRNLKKTVLELGGSDAAVVLKDADIALAAEQITTSRLLNSGQSCIAAKRVIAVDAIHDELVDALTAAFRQAAMGDPQLDATDIGPQARADLRDELHTQVTETVNAGARCVIGGERPDRPGAWYPPTLLVDVPRDSTGATDEVFGPALSVLRAADLEDAIEVANSTEFGLGVSLYTQDTETGGRIAAERLEAGCAFVNSLVKSDPRVPFGGIKQSGYGRELGREGMLEFTNRKTIWIA